MLDFFNYRNVNRFKQEYDFSGIEPFTLLIIEGTTGIQLHELIWDGLKLHVNNPDPGIPHIWSSVTLYSDRVRKERQRWFREWYQNQSGAKLEKLILFHKTGGAGDPGNNLLMNRNNEVRTVSISGIERNGDDLFFRYEDLLHNHISEKTYQFDNRKKRYTPL